MTAIEQPSCIVSKPWWRRSRWPLWCATAAVAIGVLIAVSFLFPFSLRYGRRFYLNVANGSVSILAFDDAYVQHASRATTTPSPGIFKDWYAEDAIAGQTNHPFAPPSLVVNGPITIRVQQPNGAMTSTILGHSSSAFIPLAYPLLVLFIAAAGGFVYLSRFRYPPGHCRRCGYDCRAVPRSSPCSECGHPFAA